MPPRRRVSRHGESCRTCAMPGRSTHGSIGSLSMPVERASRRRSRIREVSIGPAHDGVSRSDPDPALFDDTEAILRAFDRLSADHRTIARPPPPAPPTRRGDRRSPRDPGRRGEVAPPRGPGRARGGTRRRAIMTSERRRITDAQLERALALRAENGSNAGVLPQVVARARATSQDHVWWSTPVASTSGPCRVDPHRPRCDPGDQRTDLGRLGPTARRPERGAAVPVT